MERYLRLTEVGEIIGCTDRTVRNLIYRGEMHPVMLAGRRRVAESELRRWLDRNLVQAAA